MHKKLKKLNGKIMIEEFLSFKHMAFVAQKDCLGIGVKRGMENF